MATKGPRSIIVADAAAAATAAPSAVHHFMWPLQAPLIEAINGQKN